MAIEFIGHKKNLLPFIVAVIEREAHGAPREIADLFCGTAAVSRRFKELGYRVIANDQLVFCATFAKASLLLDAEPAFAGIPVDLGDHTTSLLPLSRYLSVVGYLNALPALQGFLYRNYSPASLRYSDVERMYFTEENSARIDAIRCRIGQWAQALTQGEEALLLCDLIRASNEVSNIAGTYGCYLKFWKERAKRQLCLKPSSITPGGAGHQVFCEDANKLVERIQVPIIYADPPYTKRQYTAYYHILETIAVGDEPEVFGKTGLRPWEDRASAYCYRDRAPQALADLIQKLSCQFFFMSYSGDGQIPHETILEILSTRGAVKTYSADYKRYKSNPVSRRDNPLKERLYALQITR
jgi:adenine-specific DNA-methyltransferase